MIPQDRLDLFVNYLCLVYHEARNVRHLIEKGCREAEPYEQLVSLPRNRQKAWEALQDLRRGASRSGSAAAASRAFAHRFRLTLEELVELYQDGCWKHASLGGNRWSEITQSVIELRNALDQGDGTQVAHLLSCIPRMCHNNGRVGEKLADLDGVLKHSGG